MNPLELLLDTSDFPARWHCGRWTDLHAWTHIGADLSVAGAYFAIPVVLVYFVRKRQDVPFLPVFWLFSAFILTCGVTHLIEATIFFHPWYRLSALGKVLTAAVSWATVVALVKTLPTALHFPAIARLNGELKREIAERQRAEHERSAALDETRKLNTELERRVHERTEALERLLHEREVLLQEVHHRVKNNLQVISSIINMQSRSLASQLPSQTGSSVTLGPAQQALEECQHRIQAIALIHESLYQSRNYAQVPFQEYAQELVRNVFHASGAPSRVSQRLALSDVDLPVDQAIPCGLILSELVTNALKHAFPGDRPGTVHVEFAAVADASQRPQLLLAVEDDGIGAGSTSGPHESSLGLKIITTLVEQLEGSLEVFAEQGSRFEIRFPSRGAAHPARHD